jgi:hypothetical protein
MSELSLEELNQIVLHEVAHLRRWDDWTNLAQKIIRSLFFFHPAVWWIEKQVSLEREMACDDAVLATTARPRAYAECLTHLAEKSLVRRSLVRRTLALAQASLGPARQTFLRVAQILDGNQPRGTRHGWKWTVPLLAGLAVASGVLAAKQPQFITFQNAPVSASNPAIAALDRTGDPLPAAFVTMASERQPATRVQLRPRVVQTKNVVPANAVPAKDTQNTSVLQSQPEASSLVHTTGANAGPTASTETIFLVVQRETVQQETAGSRQPVYEIQWWRLTVLHSAPRAARGEVPKKT